MVETYKPPKRKIIAEISLGPLALHRRCRLQKVPERHQLGGATAAVSDRLSRAIPFNALKPFDRRNSLTS
jgi:hypothetical protein